METDEISKLIYESPWMQEIDISDGRGGAILRGNSGAVDDKTDNDNDDDTVHNDETL